MLDEPPPRDKELAAALAVAIAMDQERAHEPRFGKWRMHGRRMAMVNRLSNGVV